MTRFCQTFDLLCILGFLCCTFVTCENKNLEVDCGKDRDSPITIKYIGDAYLMYSTSNESFCVSVRKSYYLVIENVNKRPECGMRWNENQKKYSIQIHIQSSRVVMEEDRVVHITCYYGEMLTNTIQNVDLIDRWEVPSGIASDSGVDIEDIRVPVDLTDYFKISVISLSKEDKTAGVEQVNEGENVTLKIELLKDDIDIKRIQISECVIEDAEDALLSYRYQLISDSCGTGAPIKNHQHFEFGDDQMSLIIRDGFEVPKLAFLNSVVFKCLAFTLQPNSMPQKSCEFVADQISLQQNLYQLMISGHSAPIRILDTEVVVTRIETPLNKTVFDAKLRENGTTYILIKHSGETGVKDYFHFLIIISVLSFLLLAYTGIVIYMCKLLNRKYYRTNSSKNLNQSVASSEHCFFDRDISNV